MGHYLIPFEEETRIERRFFRETRLQTTHSWRKGAGVNRCMVGIIFFQKKRKKIYWLGINFLFSTQIVQSLMLLYLT